jgi:hypothetical protein
VELEAVELEVEVAADELELEVEWKVLREFRGRNVELRRESTAMMGW